MELGGKIKQARLESGMSQRQLCGGYMTRNMLSQIENGSARPSMKTLEYLARTLGKPVSYFLEEQAVTSPNREAMEDARLALGLGDLERLRQALDGYRGPDATFDEERQLLEFLWHLRRGEEALRGGRLPYAVTLLEGALALEGLYITPILRGRCRALLVLAGKPGAVDCDGEVILARAAMAADPARKLEILASAEDREAPAWHLACGEALFTLGEYGKAAEHYRRLPPTRQLCARLEVCCRELGDYKGAYEYACAQRGERVEIGD